MAKATTILLGLFVLTMAALDIFGPVTSFSEVVNEADHIRRPLWLTAFLILYSAVLLAPRVINHLPGISITRQVIAWAGTVLLAIFSLEFLIGLVRGKKDPLGVPFVACFLAAAVVGALHVRAEARRLET